MEFTSGRVTADLLAWLDTDSSVRQNPDIMKMRLDLVGKLADRKRRMSSLSAGSSSCLELDPLCNSATVESNSDTDVDAATGPKTAVNMARYKTELCRSFSENGYCRYGDKCQFAHGGMELRRTSRHPRYKTELCKAYHMSGFCPYGARCNFIHNDDESLNQSEMLSRRQLLTNTLAASSSLRSAQSKWDRAVPTSGALWPSRLILGSTVDSPPQSVTDSPTPSPTSMLFDPIFDSLPSLWAAAIGSK